MAAIVWFTPLCAQPPEVKACLMGFALFAGLPTFHPWYPLALLPYAAVAGDAAVLWLAAASHLILDEVPLDMFIEYLPAYAAAAWRIAASLRRRPESRETPPVPNT